MSFSGRLEDLQLRDLLQILSLSHTSGLLQLGSDSAQAELLFDDGLVVSVWRQSEGRPTDAMALSCDTVDSALLSRARQRQQELVPFRSLDRLLVEDCDLAPTTLYAALRPAVFALVAELLGWDEGDFSFQSGPPLEILEKVACGEHFCLDKGLGAADLLRDEAAVLPGVEAGSSSVSPGSRDAARPFDADFGGEDWAVLLVDDDKVFGRRAVAALTRHGLKARCFFSGRELLDAARTCWQAGNRPLLIIDLIMPRLHGGGLLGGLELVEQLRGLQSDQACLVYSNYPCPEIEQRLRQLGVAQLFSKPRPPVAAAEVGCSVVDDFCHQLVEQAVAVLELADPAVAVAPTDNAAGPASVEWTPALPGAPSSAGLGLLKGMLQEMQSVESGDQIMLLVLRFATEMLHCAVLFSVGRERIVGLGQFGHGDDEVSADEKVRRIIIPLAEQSSLKNVVERTGAYYGPLGEGQWDKHLRRELGLSQSDDVFIGPVLSGGRVVALLCGDNRSAGCGKEQRQMLEIFLQQAGASLEKLQLTDDLVNLSALLGKRFGC